MCDGPAAAEPAAGLPATTFRAPEAPGRKQFPDLRGDASLVSSCFPTEPAAIRRVRAVAERPPPERRRPARRICTAGLSSAAAARAAIVRQWDPSWSVQLPPWCPTGRPPAAGGGRGDAGRPGTSPSAAGAADGGAASSPGSGSAGGSGTCVLPLQAVRLSAEQQERQVQRLFLEAQQRQTAAAQKLRERYAPAPPKSPKRLKRGEECAIYQRDVERLERARREREVAGRAARPSFIAASDAIQPQPPPAVRAAPPRPQLQHPQPLKGEELQEHLERLSQRPKREASYKKVLDAAMKDIRKPAVLSSEQLAEVTKRLHADGAAAQAAAVQKAHAKYVHSECTAHAIKKDRLEALIAYLNEGKPYSDRPGA